MIKRILEAAWLQAFEYSVDYNYMMKEKRLGASRPKRLYSLVRVQKGG